MKHLKYLLTLLLSLTMGICFAQNRNKVKPAHRTTISKAPTIVKERTYTLTPIQQLQKALNGASISTEGLLMPNCATERNDDETVPVDETSWGEVENLIEKDVITHYSLEDEVNTPLKKEVYMKSKEYKDMLEALEQERTCLLEHDYYIEADFNAQYDLEEQNFTFKLYNPAKRFLTFQITDSQFSYDEIKRDFNFSTPQIPEDLAYMIETGPTKALLVVSIADSLSTLDVNQIILIPRKLYLYRADTGEVLYEYVFKGDTTEMQIRRAESSTQADNDSTIYAVAEEMAQYPGGSTALLQDISAHLLYPVKAIEDRIQGIVLASFVVEKDGTIGDIKIERTLSPECDAAVVATIKKLKKFFPAKQGGRPVRSLFKLPIRFRAQ